MESIVDERARFWVWVSFRLFDEDDAADRTELPDSFRERGAGVEGVGLAVVRVGDGIGEALSWPWSSGG